MSKPPINPKQSVSGIALDPQTLERVIPESKRPDGTVRPRIKIRPGFTPQEDVSRFRGTKQAQMDANTLPKGHIIGWAPPPEPKAGDKSMSKSAKKNAKRREKKAEEKKVEDIKTKEPVKDNWEDDDEDVAVAEDAKKTSSSTEADAAVNTEALTSKMEKLDVR